MPCGAFHTTRICSKLRFIPKENATDSSLEGFVKSCNSWLGVLSMVCYLQNPTLTPEMRRKVYRLSHHIPATRNAAMGEQLIIVFVTQCC